MLGRRDRQGSIMQVNAIGRAATVGILLAFCEPAWAQQHQKVAQNVQYVICTPKAGTVGRCVVQEPVDPCPSPSAEAYPKQKFATVQQACTEARKRDECRGGLSGC